MWPDSSYLQLPHSPGPHASSTAWVLGEQYLPFSNVDTGASHVSTHTHTQSEDAEGRKRNVRFRGAVRRPMTASLRRACRMQGSEGHPLTPEMRPSQSSPSTTSSGTVKFSPSRILLRGPNTTDTCISYRRQPSPSRTNSATLHTCVLAPWASGEYVTLVGADSSGFCARRADWGTRKRSERRSRSSPHRVPYMTPVCRHVY
jgi:hypothetical protein